MRRPCVIQLCSSLIPTSVCSRMLRSAQNFATGFFGYPAEEQYNLEVTIEAWGVNNTLAPYMTVGGRAVETRRSRSFTLLSLRSAQTMVGF